MDDVQRRLARALPAAARWGLEPPEVPARAVPLAQMTDPVVLEPLLAEHARGLGGSPPRTAATVWWYAASALVVAPPALGALVGVPVSADDLVLHLGHGALPLAVTGHRPGAADPGPDLGATLAALVDALAAASGARRRPLWAIAVDALANRLLEAGRALGRVDEACDVAAELTRSAGAPVPPPRFVDVPVRAAATDAGGEARFVVRNSCCLLYRIPGGSLCSSCPRRPAADRAHLLKAAAPAFRTRAPGGFRAGDVQRFTGTGTDPDRTTEAT